MDGDLTEKNFPLEDLEESKIEEAKEEPQTEKAAQKNLHRSFSEKP